MRYCHQDTRVRLADACHYFSTLYILELIYFVYYTLASPLARDSQISKYNEILQETIDEGHLL
jgi:hypothetical protein